MSLSPSQMAAVSHNTGPCEVIAGPGSGKTTVLVSRIRFLSRQCGADPSRILVLTFTRAAAQVMRRRSSLLFERSDEVTFSTFHALFLNILSSFQSRSRVIGSRERLRFLKMKAEDYYPCASLQPDPEDLSARITRKLAVERETPALGDRDHCEREDPVFERIFEEYLRYLRQQDLLDLDELAAYCERRLREDPARMEMWKNRWDYILVDEFQDINRPQYDLVRLLSARTGNLFVVGDDDQSIYGFRGSSPRFMLLFQKDYPDAARHMLTGNYRSTPGIVAASSAVIGANRIRIPKRLHSAGAVPYTFREAVRMYRDVSLLGVPDEKSQEAAVVRILRELLRSEPAPSAALITRTHRDAGRWEKVLEKAGIHSLHTGMRQYGADPRIDEILEDIRAWYRVSAGIHAGVPRADLLRILNRPDRGLGRELLPGEWCTAQQLLQCCRGRRGTEKAVKRLLEDLDSLRGLSPLYFLRFLFGPVGYWADRMRRDPAGEAVLGKLRTQLYTEAGKPGCKDLEQVLESARDHKTDICPDHSKNNDQISQEVKGPELCTMHACKGREFDLVLLPDLSEGVMPSRKNTLPGEIEEERRLLYVAMTRARRKLVLFWPEGTEQNKRMPSVFLRPLGIRSGMEKHPGVRQVFSNMV